MLQRGAGSTNYSSSKSGPPLQVIVLAGNKSRATLYCRRTNHNAEDKNGIEQKVGNEAEISYFAGQGCSMEIHCILTLRCSGYDCLHIVCRSGDQDISRDQPKSGTIYSRYFAALFDVFHSCTLHQKNIDGFRNFIRCPDLPCLCELF